MSWTELTQHPNFPLWILLAGLLLIAVAALLIWRKISFFRRSQVTVAQNVSFNKRSALEGNLWETIVEFSDDEGIGYQLNYTSSGAYPLFAKVDALKVYYDPQNPKKAYAYSFWKVWVSVLVIISIAFLMILIGVSNLYL